MTPTEKTERTKSKKVSSTVDLDLYTKIENEAQRRNMNISEFIRMVLSDFFVQDEKEKDNHIIELEIIPSEDSQAPLTKKPEVIDIDSHKLKRIAEKFNENLNSSNGEETEAEFRRLLREKKRKENKYNGSC